MTRMNWKEKALSYIRTAVPNPCIVTVPIVVMSWLFSLLAQRMHATPLYINMDALEKKLLDN